MARSKKVMQDEDPWSYCSKCYSIRFKYEDSIGMDCCEDCGCTDFVNSSFEEWDKVYRNRYGHPYLEDKGLIKKSPIFLLSDEQLKARLFKHPSCMKICKTLYSSFPEGLSKEDSVLLLFSKLCQDNRVDALRLELINQNNK